MSVPVHSVVVHTGNKSGQNEAQPTAVVKNYKGFVAGLFSGIAKLSGQYLEAQQVLC